LRDLAQAFSALDFHCASEDVLRWVSPDCLPLMHPDSEPARAWLLNRRSLTADVLPTVASHFALLYDPARGRMVFPHVANRVIVGVTERNLAPRMARERWRTVPTHEAAWFTLYDLDTVLAGGDELWIVEGPVDCLTGYAASLDLPGVVVTSTFHVGVTDVQAALLRGVAPLYGRVVVCFDGDARSLTMQCAARIGARAVLLPLVADDFGALPYPTVRRVVEWSQQQHGSIVDVPTRRAIGCP
jgi:hypothetical protein